MMTRTDRRRFPIPLAAIAALAVAMALLFSPVQAQDGSAPAKPTGLYATATHDQVILTWDDPGDDSITGYVILRRVRVNNTGGEFSELVADTGTAATTYTDSTVAASTTYTYRIKAINEHGVSERSRWFHIDIPAAPERPDKPTGLFATATHDSVMLTWNDPQDDSVTGYAVVRWGLGYNSSGTVTIAPDTGYTDETVEPETEYIYNIKAINAQGESEKSEPLRVKTAPAPDPADLAPANLTVELVDGQVVLGWDAPVLDAGAVTGYEVLRARGEDESTTLVADTGSSATAYTDETADAAGDSYAYRVKAVRDGERSQASDAAVVQLPDPPPSAPSGLAAYYGNGGVSLVWNTPTEDAGLVTGYEILRAQGGDALTTLAADTGNAATAYTDFSAGGTSESYAYRVRAIRGEERSADSNEARVQLPPAAPKRVVSAASSDLVLLSWADPQDSSVTGYRILRRHWAADEPGDFHTLAEDTGSAEPAYSDDTVETGRVYVYRVLAINPGGVSEPSQDLRVRTTTPVAPRTGARAHVATTLLSNLGQDTVSNAAAAIGDGDSAQGFTTGSNLGVYNLRGVKLDLAVAPGFPEDARVELWSATSDATPLPDARIAALTHATGTWATGSNTFNAPAGTTLKSGTTYFVFLSYSGSDATLTAGFHLAITTATDADADSAPGWSVGQYTNRTRSPQGSWATPSSAALIQYAVEGSFVVNPDPPGQNVSEPPGGDCGSGAATQCRVAVGESATGNIGTIGDSDNFAVYLEAGHKYQIDVEGADTGQGTLKDPRFNGVYEIYKGDLGFIPSSGDVDSGTGNNALKIFTLPSETHTGTYWVQVIGGNNDATGTYRIRVREVVGSGYGKTYPIDGRLTPGSELSGTLPVHDGYFGKPHYFALDGLEVGRYTVSFSTGSIDSIHTFWRRPDNPDLDDVWILTQAFGRSSYTFDVRAGREGTHYALLYIKEGAGGDYTATLEEAMPSLTVGGPAVEGEIREDKGNDYPGYGNYMLFYSVDLVAGETYQVDVKGKDTCNDCTMDHTMLGHVQAPDGSFVEDDNNLFAVGGGEGRNTRYVFTADQDGTYFLKVGGRIFGFANDVSRYRAGTFKVSIQEVP